MPGACPEAPRHTFFDITAAVVRHAWTGMCEVVILAGFSKSRRLSNVYWTVHHCNSWRM